jgi:hypothetical protein
MKSGSSSAASVKEAQILVRRCAEPRPPGDLVKAAVARAASRAGLPFPRIREIWYGNARRIEAEEMDRLRREAEKAEVANAVAGIKTLRNRMLVSRSPASDQVVAGLNTVLEALGYDAGNARKRSDEVLEVSI